MSLEDKLKQLPASPGVYLMRDAAGIIIYVGKARSLRQRVRSYFGTSSDARYHVKFLMAKIADIEVMVTDTEKEALLLENTLIKQHHPRYNLDLKDDKTYFSLRLDLKEQFPRFCIVRKIPHDSARYFGPYASASAAREVLRQITRMFPLRHYPLNSCLTRKRPCLYHQIGQCSAPCHSLISAEDYSELVKGAMLFLDGKGRELVAKFRQRMIETSQSQRYEEAGRWRNLLRSIEVTVEKQKMVMKGGDSDVLGYYRDGDRLELALMFIRAGVMNGSRLFSLTWELGDAEGISSFLQQYYTEGTFIPDEILLPIEIEDKVALAAVLTDVKRHRVTILHPLRGVKRELVDLAGKNAFVALRERDEKQASVEGLLGELKNRLQLSRLPRRIECYDISTIQGQFSVGSGVSFLDGKTDKSNYRHYRIRTVTGQDDFAMLREVFSRRFREESIQKNGLPDLVVVDGGISQLNATLDIISILELNNSFDLVSLAKSRVTKKVDSAAGYRSDERVFLPGRKNPVVLHQNSPALLLLVAIRDEAHRFAIEYHRTLRSKEGIASGIEQIPGIGTKRRTALLQQFGSLQRLREADVDEISKVDGMNHVAAMRVYEWLKKD